MPLLQTVAPIGSSSGCVRSRRVAARGVATACATMRALRAPAIGRVRPATNVDDRAAASSRRSGRDTPRARDSSSPRTAHHHLALRVSPHAVDALEAERVASRAEQVVGVRGRCSWRRRSSVSCDGSASVIPPAAATFTREALHRRPGRTPRESATTARASTPRSRRRSTANAVHRDRAVRRATRFADVPARGDAPCRASCARGTARAS